MTKKNGAGLKAEKTEILIIQPLRMKKFFEKKFFRTNAIALVRVDKPALKKNFAALVFF